MIYSLIIDLLGELSKIITGKLLTDAQVQSIASSIVGNYIADWFPTPQREAEAEARIANARLHIAEATKIITSLQDDLESQATQLELLAKEIDEKKKIAERYAVLMKADQDALAAFRSEMEEIIRKELVTQAEKGEYIRRSVSFVFWTITLILGAALGAYLETSFEPIFKPATGQNISNNPVSIQSETK